MKYFKINYCRLQNLTQINYYIVVFVMLILIVILLLIASLKTISIKEEYYGIYVDNVLNIKINVKLSDKFKSKEHIIFNNKKTKYKIVKFNDFEIVNNEIYQNITLALDEDFHNNEVGLVELYYDKKSILNYIFELFK